jgi:hypothetical protein
MLTTYVHPMPKITVIPLPMRSAFFWDIAQGRVVILCRRFGTILLDLSILEVGTDTLSRNVGTELPIEAA